eukprot:TRINITY_DN48323_c0_g1_i1.p1 TRINITY_DN48323_c0_g1~~TRINITY_DN48323_c0_g1_i1.p1  ORF type:complete len:642 (-),score=145.66 TRINITY_DN48323_c0_g1_i1:46-1971(-)
MSSITSPRLSLTRANPGLAAQLASPKGDAHPPFSPDQNGIKDLGGEGMLGFFRTQMDGILQPFAENVQEMHKVLAGLADEVHQLREMTEGNCAKLSDHSTLLAGLRSDLDKTTALEHATHKLLETTRTEKAAMGVLVDANQESTRQNVERIDGILATQQRGMDELRKSLEDNRSRLTMCQDTSTMNQIEVVRTNAAIDRMASSHAAAEATQEKLLESLNSLKKQVDTMLADNKAEKHDMLSAMQKSDKISEIKFGELDKKASEALRYASEIPWVVNSQHECASAVHANGAKLDQAIGQLEGLKGKVGQIDVITNDSQTKLADIIERFGKHSKQSDAKHARDMQDMKRYLESNSQSISKNQQMLKELTDSVYGPGSSASDRNNIIRTMQQDLRSVKKRADRIETVVAIPPLDEAEGDAGFTLKNGLTLSERQINQFQTVFQQFDADHSGSITVEEVGGVIRGLGHEVEDDALALIVKDLDRDHSGEISFEEFCHLMARMLGPDGQVDLENYLLAIAEDAAREAKQNQAAEAVPMLQEEMKKTTEALEHEMQKHSATTQKLRSLEGQHAMLVEEVRRLSWGLQQSQEYWKGMADGLRETKKSYGSGDPNLLPCPKALRQALPPLGGSRPATSQGHAHTPLSAR